MHPNTLINNSPTNIPAVCFPPSRLSGHYCNQDHSGVWMLAPTWKLSYRLCIRILPTCNAQSVYTIDHAQRHGKFNTTAIHCILGHPEILSIPGLNVMPLYGALWNIPGHPGTLSIPGLKVTPLYGALWNIPVHPRILSILGLKVTPLYGMQWGIPRHPDI